jgi:adenosylcobinamide kinase/adenosylcobinamide-phosphate guanylyltransferase
MAKIHLITGGQRSGKSSLAQELAKQISPEPVYLATSRIWDEDFQQRVNRHKNDRGNEWRNIEEEKYISKVNLPDNSVVVLDCITLWLTNFFHDNKFDLEKSVTEAKQEWDKFTQKNIILFVVTNEIGMGSHAQTASARRFGDLQGWINQYIARQAEKVSLMISGIAVRIK